MILILRVKDAIAAFGLPAGWPEEALEVKGE